MNNDQERTELLQQIDKLLSAVDTMQTCLENPVVSKADGRFDIARADLRSTASEAAQVIERQNGAQTLNQKARQKTTLSKSLFAAAEASEWQANKLKTNGDEAGSCQASADAVTLRRMASEAAVTERRQSIHLVPPIDQE
ncbi:hypothetical protein ACTJKT_01360 [Pseudomonas sp. 22526]|uniref:hypothetical protein n=1 Tax=Pseudomonas sp. 22526 TaxID=3453937 RepID=UPI003F84AA23